MGKGCFWLDIKYGDFTEKLKGVEVRARPGRRKVDKAGNRRLTE